MRLIAETKKVTETSGGKEAEVVVIGPKITRDIAKRIRARSQAVVSTGPKGAASATVNDITTGEINRLTEIKAEESVDNPETIQKYLPEWVVVPDVMTLEAIKYTVSVRDE